MKSFVLVCLLTAALRLQAQNHSQPHPCPQPSHISIENGTFSSQAGVVFTLHHFVATLVPRAQSFPGCLEKTTVMTHGEIFVSNESLTQVFTGKLTESESKIKDFTVVNGLGHATLSGHLTKVIPINFSVTGPVTTDGTSLLLDASQIKADGVPVKALLGMVGEHLSAVLNLKGMAGIAVKENQLVFAPEQIAHLKGHIDSVETNERGLVLRYTTPSRPRR